MLSARLGLEQGFCKSPRVLWVLFALDGELLGSWNEEFGFYISSLVDIFDRRR